MLLGGGAGGGDGDGGTPLFCAIIISFTILLLRSAQASAPKSILRLSLKAMFSDKKLVNDVKERGMSGYDVKLSGQAPYLPWAKIKGTYYYWDAKTGPNISQSW
jgi:hypothetical protein